MAVMMANVIQYEKPSPSWIITEYDPKYCNLLCDYAYTYFDIDGFYGQYNISPIAAKQWELEHDDWRDAVIMAEYKKKAGIAYHLSKLLEYSKGGRFQDSSGKVTDRPPDIDLMQKVLFKMSDNNLRVEKDSGDLRRKGMENARKSKMQSTNNIDNNTAVKIAQDLLRGNK